MQKEDIGFIFLYITVFGFSDYIVECMSLTGEIFDVLCLDFCMV